GCSAQCGKANSASFVWQIRCQEPEPISERETGTQLVLDFPQELPGSVHNKMEGPLGQIRPIRSFAIRPSVAGRSQRGWVCARPAPPAGPGGRQVIVASGERENSGQWPVKPE